MSNETESCSYRGQEVWGDDYQGARFYVGESPYGRKFIVPKADFDEICIWFDEQEATKWQVWW